MHENCLHYQLIRGEAIEVEKGDYYEITDGLPQWPRWADDPAPDD